MSSGALAWRSASSVISAARRSVSVAAVFGRQLVYLAALFIVDVIGALKFGQARADFTLAQVEGLTSKHWQDLARGRAMPGAGDQELTAPYLRAFSLSDKKNIVFVNYHY